MSDLQRVYIGNKLIYDKSDSNPYKADDFFAGKDTCEEVYIGSDCIFKKVQYGTLVFQVGPKSKKYNFTEPGGTRQEYTCTPNEIISKEIELSGDCKEMFLSYYTGTDTDNYVAKILKFPDTSQVTDFSSLFHYHNADVPLEIVDVDKWDLSNCDRPYGMFYRRILSEKTCEGIAKWKPKRCNMFNYTYFKSIDLSAWPHEHDKTDYTNDMMWGCGWHKSFGEDCDVTVNISGWKLYTYNTGDSNEAALFRSCKANKLIFSNVDFSNYTVNYGSNRWRFNFKWCGRWDGDPVEITGPLIGLNHSIDFTGTTLTHDSVLTIFNGFETFKPENQWDKTGEIILDDRFGATDEEIAEMTAKGWTVIINAEL